MLLKKRKTKIKIFIVLIIGFISLCIFLFLIQFKKNVLPVAVSLGEKFAVTEINKNINKAVSDIVEKSNITSKDFYENSFDDASRLNYLTLNTILINKICSETAVSISESLNNMGNREIELPIGIFSGTEAFSNIGPNFKIRILNMGEAKVDYETAFNSVGINQINFQVWLNIETEAEIVNPFYEKEISVKRKLALVNTVFNGEVPKAYLDTKALS